MSTIQDELIELRNEGPVVIAEFVKGSFRDEKQILVTLEKLGGVIDSREKVQMVLDMSKIEYLSSAGLGRIVSLLKKAMSGGGCLHLAQLAEPIQELFEVMRLTQIFKIFPSVDEAVEAF